MNVSEVGAASEQKVLHVDGRVPRRGPKGRRPRFTERGFKRVIQSCVCVFLFFGGVGGGGVLKGNEMEEKLGQWKLH